MGALRNFRIGTKIYAVIGLLAGVAVFIGWTGVDAMRTYQAQVDQMVQASKRAVLGERVNETILAVVMDSRGIYMAQDAAELQKYGTALMAGLKKLEGLMAEWKALMPADARARFESAEAHARQFAEFRTQLVRLGRDFDIETARSYGDNAASRANRSALNDEITALADENTRRIASLESGLSAYSASRVRIMILTGAAGILATIGLALVIVVFGITGPLNRMAGAMTAVAGGDLEVDVPALGRRDEVGKLAAALQSFKAAGQENKRLQAERLAAEQRVEADKKAALDKMADAFEAGVKEVVEGVAAASAQMQISAQGLSATAKDTTLRSTAVAAASEQASRNMQTVASAAEELSASIGEIGRQVAESADIAARAAADAGRTNQQVRTLAAAAERIGAVVTLINEIAGRTNLLALNATIEAARAGDAGKGFAVVASEVKSLATQTARATDDIAAQVKAIQGATAESVKAIGAIGGTIGRINEIASGIASAVEQQGAATDEIARSVQQASAGTTEVSANIAGVTRAAAQTGQASADVLSEAGALSARSEQLRLEVDRFLGIVRAA